MYSGGGYDGLKPKRDLALRARRRGIPTVVLTVSDCDDHGRRIARAAAEDCTAWAAHFGADEGWLSFERIALTEEQAAEHGLLGGPLTNVSPAANGRHNAGKSR